MIFHTPNTNKALTVKRADYDEVVKNWTLKNDHPEKENPIMWTHCQTEDDRGNRNRLKFAVHVYDYTYRNEITIREHYTIYGGND